MNTSPTKSHGHWLAAFAATAALVVLPQTAFAVGTAANTDITNKASLSFTSGGGAAITLESSPTGNTATGVGAGTITSFKVDRRVNLLVAKVDAAIVTASAGSTNVITTFNVTNSGNDTQDFILTVGQLAAGTANPFGGALTDSFDTTACTIAADNNNDGTYTAADTLNYLDNIPADQTRKVFVRCTVPATAANATIAVIQLTAQAADGSVTGTLGAAATESAGDTAGVDTVLGDAAGSDDSARDGKHSARNAYQAQAAVLTFQKTDTLICDPLNGNSAAKRIPGAFVKYTMLVSNSGSASAVLGTLTDTIASSVTFDTRFVAGTTAAACVATGASVAGASAGNSFRFSCGGSSTRTCTTAAFQSNVADTDAASFAGSAVTVNYPNSLPAGTFGVNTYTAGELKAGESVTVEFQVSIN